jgi:hypothetical protein
MICHCAGVDIAKMIRYNNDIHVRSS